MKDTATKPQNTIEPGKDSSGLGVGSDGGKKEGIPQNAPTHQKRQRFDKDGHPLISKGFLIRADIDKKYDIKSAILHVNKYELVNDALLYYYENVLNKTKSQKLLEAGQEELGI
jgi:hypothetical protein